MSKNNVEDKTQSLLKQQGTQSRERKVMKIGGVPPQRREQSVPPDVQTGASGTGSFTDFIYNGGPIINIPQVYAIFFGDWRPRCKSKPCNEIKSIYYRSIEQQIHEYSITVWLWHHRNAC